MRSALLLLLICGLTFLAGLGRAAVGDSDEAFYAESAREMVESGDWLTPHYNYEYRFQKPILYYWLTAATYLLAGVGPGTARFWSALSCIGLVFVTWSIARRWYDERTGLIAGLIVATSFGTFTLARLALPDGPLAFFITLTIAVAITPPRARLKPGTTTTSTLAVPDFSRADVVVPGFSRAWSIAAAAAAFGFLTKGPVAVILPALVLLPVVLVERRWRELSPRTVAIALAIFVAIALPWYAAMTIEHGTSYLHGFFVGDNLERFATDRFNEPRTVLFYLPVAAGGLLPWTPLGLLWLRPARPGPREWRLLLWLALPLLFFSLSVGKQPRYILPVLPPLAILLASSVARATKERERPALFATGCALSGLLLVGLALLVWRARSLVVHSTDTALLAAAAVMAVGGMAILVHVLSARWRSAPFTIAAAAAVTLAALHYSVLSSAGPEPVEQVASIVVRERHASERSARYQVLVRNLVFYTWFRQEDLFDAGRFTSFLESPDRVICVLPKRALDEYESQRATRLTRLAEVPYFNVSTVKLRSLLRPDPKTDLETLVVVSNR